MTSELSMHGLLGGRPMYDDRRMRAAAAHHHQQALNCPRCDSLNTKFCYYNNYNLSQPRHFCKNCRRYWTKGGVLRNVPVGGGCRKSKRGSKARKNTSSPRPHNSNSGSSGETTSIARDNSGDTVNALVSKPGSDRPPVTFDGAETSEVNVNFEAVSDQRGVLGFQAADHSSAGLFTDIGGLLLGGDQHQGLLSPLTMYQQNQVNHLQLLEDQWGTGILDLAGADWQGNGGTHLGFYGLTTAGCNGNCSQSSSQCNGGSDDCHLNLPQ